MQATSKNTLAQAAIAAAAGVAAALLAASITHNAQATEAPTLAQQPKAKRSAAAVRAFRQANPCPATGRASGACPGYVVDHIQPLCAGGADSPRNMQWQTVAEAKKKDAEEHRMCRAKRKGSA